MMITPRNLSQVDGYSKNKRQKNESSKRKTSRSKRREERTGHFPVNKKYDMTTTEEEEKLIRCKLKLF